MALKLPLTLDSGIELPAAYARISSVTHSHDEIIVFVQIWASSSAREDLKSTVRDLSFSVPWQESVSLADAYDALKDEDLFAEAEDC